VSTTSVNPVPHHRWRKRYFAIIGAAVLVVLAFLFGYLPRHRARSKLVAETSAQQGPLRVAVVRATAADTGHQLTLPANLAPAQRTFVYARASGFVRRWLVDIGARVRKGDLLAELDTPELTQQLEQAKATVLQRVAALAQMRASLAYAKITAERNHALFVEALIAQQQDDQTRTQADVAAANVKAAIADLEASRAMVRQLEQLIAFGRVVAPFDGTITQRLVEVGNLVNAGAGSTTASLFELEATNPILAYTNVPQPYAPSVQKGADVKVTVRQFPGRDFAGKVSNTAGALDPTSRTLRTEVNVPNEKGELLAGMYGEVSISVDVSHRIVRVPSSAILADARGIHVAIVDAKGLVHLVAVQLGLDNGTNVDVVSGLQGGEQIIATPPSDAADGLQVAVVESGSASPSGAPPSSGTPPAGGSASPTGASPSSGTPPSKGSPPPK
jgi:RND family efflux transporter MFP subunit